MTVAQGFAVIITSGLGFAFGGCCFGYALGRIAPSYYRSVFQRGESPGFNSEQVGIGLGVSQGLIAGLVVVLAVVLSGLRRSTKESLDRA